MIDIKHIYEKEKQINALFRKIYDYSDPEIFSRHVLELSIEIGEFAYETKCFKYWKPEEEIDIEKVLFEYADCLMIILSFCDLANIDIGNLPEVYEKNIIKQFNKLFELSPKIDMVLQEKLLLEILSNLLNVTTFLDYTEEEIEEYCDIKMGNTLEMIRSKQKI